MNNGADSPAPDRGRMPDQAEELYDFNPDPLAGRCGFEFLGRIAGKASCDIPASMLGVGFETLDRETFDPAPVIRVLAGSGVKHARCQTGWIRCERQPGVYSFDWLDEVVDRLAEVGISTWLSLSFGHPQYTPNDEFARRWRETADHLDIPGWARGYVGEVPLYHGEAAMRAWLAYVRALVRHFRGRVGEFEVWNEPEFFWCRNARRMLPELGAARAAADYTEFVRRTAEVIRAEQPGALVAGVAAGTGSVYIRELGRAGLGKYIDVFCFHNYSCNPEYGLRQAIEHIRAHLCVPGRALQIWQGESGRASGPSRLFAFPSQYNQAKFLVRRYVGDLAGGAERSSFFTASDFLNYYEDGSDQFYGVINGRTGEPKLAFYAMRCCGWLFDGLVRAPDIIGWFAPHSRSFGSVLPYALPVEAFRRKGVPVFAIWQPERVDISAPRVEGSLSLVTDDPCELPDPVVIDPVRCNVYAVGTRVRSFGDEKFRMALRIEPFAPVDYPLFITDRAVFDDCPLV